ncbi:hypothetical protein CPB85DRAFT_834938 [Mucidula mucida]|nr:hypothetical protein CPB85DRAFT_834938 [Mucidula mucida]
MARGNYIVCSYYGLGYFHESNFVALPLRHVRATVAVKDIGAQVKLTQTFGNDTQTPIEAVYAFPVPARAAVSGFVMIKEDGTRVVGVVQEKGEAKATYDVAVAQGKTASLMGQETPDVFQVSVGNIPMNEQVKIELTYSTELSEDEENDSIRFHLPVHIGARYGQSPSTLKSTGTATVGSVREIVSSPGSRDTSPFIELKISVEATAPISKVGCPSHTISTELGPDPELPNVKELPFSNYARVTLTSESVLEKDFVLTIKAAGLDAPRCMAELHPEHDTLAMALSFVPRFSLPDLKSEEFIFLVDRSGSMEGGRIAAASKALAIMLRSLPHMNTYFQIASFGSHADMLWPEGSRPYDQETLDDATRHVDGMRANYGGTEMRSALAMCFKYRKTDRPTSVFVLTDGDAWDLEGVYKEVKDAVAAAPSKAYLRVYCLGIGDSASTAMCEGIARVGNGTCMMVTEQESAITGKIARLLKAARTPLISDIKVDWGRPLPETTSTEAGDEDEYDIVESMAVEETKKESLNIFDESTDPTKVDTRPLPSPPKVVLPPPPAVQTSPATIQSLSPGVRLNVYVILKGKQVPKTVCLRGVTEDGSDIELPIPVTLSQLPVEDEGVPPALHALAARKIVQDFEDGRHDSMIKAGNESKFTEDSGLLKRTTKAHIVRLGKTYSIVSSHTSFVAVDESGQKYAGPPPLLAPTAGKHTGRRRLSIVGQARDQYVGCLPQKNVIRAKSVKSFNFTGSGWDDGAFEEKCQDRGQVSLQARGKVAVRKTQERGVPAAGAKEPLERNVFASSANNSQDPLETLAIAQAFDGGFSLKALQVIKVDEEKAKAALPDGLKVQIVATVFVMAFISKILNSIEDADEKAPWEAIFDKAKMYIEAGGHPVDDWIAKALKAL